MAGAAASQEIRPSGAGRGRFGKRHARPAAAPETPPAAAPEPGETPGAETPPAAPVAAGQIRIDLPESHPLREQGLSHIDVPEGSETQLRATINSWTRRADVERANDARKAAANEATRYKLQVARLEAEAELRRSGALNQFDDPQLQKMLADADAHDPERAKLLREGIEAQKRALVQQAVGNAERDVRDTQEATEFLDDFGAKAPALYAVWHGQGEAYFKQRVAPVLGEYGRRVDARIEAGGAGASVSEFTKYLDHYYAQDPQVRSAVEQHRKTEAERIREEGIKAGREATRSKSCRKSAGRPLTVTVTGHRRRPREQRHRAAS